MAGHSVEDLKGRLKVAAGDLTGDEALKREGRIDQASAATKDVVEDAAEKIKEAVRPKH
jgi:uncharacterized protein YjbJ (UPF0337 family)